jgi:4-amino-4-deoxy-L-arabinose transferase-like glycosyltransferase
MTDSGASPAASSQDARPWGRWFAFLCLFQLVAWTLIPLLLHPNVTLDVAEIVSWGHQWQFGYYKHPPLIAWMEEAARQLEFLVGGGSGGKPWAIYLCGQIAIVATFWAVWRFSRRLLSARESFIAVLGLAATYVCTLTSLEFNHNILLLPFFALTGWFAFEALRAPGAGWGWWMALGAAIGLGMLSKYEMFFLAACIALFILLDPRSRKWLRRPQPYAALILSLLIFAPNFKWLVDHHFASLTYAESRMSGMPGIVGHLFSPFLFLVDQLLYLLPVYLLMIPWIGLPRIRPATDPDQRWNRRFLATLALGSFVPLTLMALITGNILRGEWGVPLMPFMPMLLLFWFTPRKSVWASYQTVALGILLVGIELVFAIAQPPLAPLLTKKPLRVQFPGRQLAAAADQRWHALSPTAPLPVVAGDRWLADNVAFYSAYRPAVLCDQGPGLDKVKLDEVNCPWTSIAAVNRDGGVLVWNAATEGKGIPPALRDAFPQAMDAAILELPWQTWQNMGTVKVGIAIVPAATQK